MEFSAIRHSSDNKQVYLLDNDIFHIWISTKKDDVEKITLMIGDPYNWTPLENDSSRYEYAEESFDKVEMSKLHSDKLLDHWLAEIPAYKRGRYKYAFFLDDFDGNRFFWGNKGEESVDSGAFPTFDHFLYFNLPATLEEDAYRAPEWVKDTIWYQIFPDRFAKEGKAELKPLFNSKYDRNEYAGGSLKGITENLDYIEEMGFTAIYLTPIFSSNTSHMYDTVDYMEIDPHLGTKDDLKELVDTAHSKNIRIMLDAVFNHCGENHEFWQDVLEKGTKSKYFDYFYFFEEDNSRVIFDVPKVYLPDIDKEMYYLCFAYDKTMPKFNTSNPELRKYLINVGLYWIEEFGIDAWRLDVSNEVSHDFWRAFRNAIISKYPETYILGENWFNSAPWLQGDQMDGVMNYEFKNITLDFLKEGSKVSSREFSQNVDKLLATYPKHVALNLYNLLDCHDTDRALTELGTVESAKLAYSFMFAYPGAPSIYYGSEIGYRGDESMNRDSMNWDESTWDKDLQSYIRNLIMMRKENTALRSNRLVWISTETEGRALVFRKDVNSEARDDSIFVFINPGNEDYEVSLENNLKGKSVVDLISRESFGLEDSLILEPKRTYIFSIK